MKNRKLEQHRAEKGRKCSIVSDEGRKSSLTSESSIRIEIEDGDGGYFDDENTVPYDKLKSALSAIQDKSNGENKSDDVGNVDIEVQNCFASSTRRLESRKKDRGGLRGREGRERGRERRGGQLQTQGQRHLCSAPESRVHSDEEDCLEDRGCNLDQYDYSYDNDNNNDDDNNDDDNNENDDNDGDGEDVENDHHNININKKELLLSPIVTSNNQGQSLNIYSYSS